MDRNIVEVDLGMRSRPLQVLNSGFEISTDGKVDSWLIAEPGGSFNITTEKSYSGERSLRLETCEMCKAAIRTEKVFTAREGYSYKACVMCLPIGAENNPSMHIEFWKSDGMIAGSNSVTCENKGLEEWQKLEVMGIAPVGTVMATILLQGDTASKGTVYFDCVHLEELKEENMPNALSSKTFLDFCEIAGSTGIISNNIPVFEGKEYAAVIDAFTEKGTALISIEFWNTPDLLIQSFKQEYAFENEMSLNHDRCKKLICRATAPIGTQYAVLKAEVNEGTFTWLDKSFFCISTSISNASMENINTYGSGSLPYNWIPYDDILAFSDGIEYYDGMLSLGIAYPHDCTGGGVRSSIISGVEEGKEYIAGVMAKCKAGSMNLVMEFWDDEFNCIIRKIGLISGNLWQKYEVTVKAPAGSKYASLAFESLNGNAGTAYFDKAEFTPAVRDIASYTQLFIDDYIIDKISGMSRTFHQAQKTGPVIERDKPWEDKFVYIYGTVFYDEQDKIYKMWYTAFANKEYRTCYATSPDGISWYKPSDLGVTEYEGKKDNNIVTIRGGQSNVIKDTKESDPQKRYKSITYAGKNQYCIYYSPDGLHWSEGPKVMDGADVVTVVYDSNKNEYISLFKINTPGKRLQRNSISEDMVNWSTPIRMNSLADPMDSIGFLRADSYGAGLYPYEGVYIGFNWLFQITGNKLSDGPVDVHLIFSRDLSEDWQRPTRVPIIPRGTGGNWDSGCIYTAAQPIQMGDEVWLYYGGFDGTHKPGCEYHAAIGIAKWRLDGFASMDCTASGTLETKPLTFKGDYLYLNADAAGGSIKVELLDVNGKVIPGFSKQECSEITGNNVKFKVEWESSLCVNTLEGKVIRLKIYCKNSSIYSFGFK